MQNHDSNLVLITRTIDYLQSRMNLLNEVIAQLELVGAGPEAHKDAQTLKHYVRKRLSAAQWQQAELAGESANRIAESVTGLLRNDRQTPTNSDALDCDYDGFGGAQ